MSMSRFFRRTLIHLLALFLVLAICTSLLTSWTLYRHMHAEYTSKGIAIARSIASTSVEVLLNRDPSTTQAMIDQFLDIQGTGYVLVVDSKGDIISHTFVPSIPGDILALPKQSETTVTRVTVPRVGDFIDVSAPILAGAAGQVHVGMDRSLILSSIKTAILQLQLIILGVFLLAVVVMYLLVLRVSGPLSALTDYARRLAAQEFDAELTIRGRDEIGVLARTLRFMAQRIHSLITGLEQAVDESTSELKNTLVYLRSIVHNLADGLLVTDTNGRITHFNPTLLNMYSLGDAELAHRDIRTAFPQDLNEVLKAALDQRHEVRTREVELADGRMGQAAAVSIHPPSLLEDGQSEPPSDDQCLGVVVLIRDITREKVVDRMKTEFTSTVSHELRTPLTSIQGFISLAKKKYENTIKPRLDLSDSKVVRASEQISNNLEVVLAESKRLGELINDVLDISKMESGRIEWHMQHIDLAELLNSTLVSLRGLLDDKGLLLYLDVQDDLPEIVADRNRLIQVIVNLVSNAVKFTDQGSISIIARMDDDFVRISVADTGMGIHPKDHERIFDRFQQAGSGNTLSDKPKGTGLGLAICRHIIETHGGEISLDSLPGKGSTFKIRLPLRPPSSPANLRKKQPKVLPGKEQPAMNASPAIHQSSSIVEEPPLVLVVDDEAHVREYLTQLLEEKGYRVMAAESGQRALDIARLVQPDLITMDLLMPGLSGNQVIAELKRNPKTSTIPVVVVTALKDLEESIDADASFNKPVDEEALLNTLHGLLLGEAIRNGSCLVVTADSVGQTYDSLMLCPHGITYAKPEELDEYLHQGFQGAIFIPAHISRQLDLLRLTRRRGVQVVILPS